MTLTLGSLFDGSGGFPLAGSMCGIEPIWASEVEPYPIAVTSSRFPLMEHLGSVTDINGAEVEPVDIITFGSPCQDLSVAGKRTGLKHEANGDDETTRSGLFMEAVRIIKEMREATNANYPKWAVWENVPGAFSSNKGEDFRIVLEELIKTVEPNAVMPPVPKNGWPYADCYYGDGWSLAYRTLDAQFWGVPQRRKRIYLILDLTGQRAGSVLFEREGLRGHFAESGASGKAVAGDAENCIGAADREGAERLHDGGSCENSEHRGGAAADAEEWGAIEPQLAVYGAGRRLEAVAYSFDSLASNSMKSSNPHSGCRQVEVAKCLDTTDPNPCKNQGGIAALEPIPIHDKATRYQGGGPTRKGDGAGNGLGVGKPGDPVPTLSTCDRHMVAYLASGKDSVGTLMASMATKQCLGDQEAFSGDYHIIEEHDVPIRYIVRRLTPTECARLQGFPDNWGHPNRVDSITDGDYRFWLNVRKTHAAINGKSVRDYTEEQIMSWYNKLHTDSAEFKLWGNGVALPCVLFVMEGIAEVSKTGGDADEIQPETSPSHC